MGRTRSNIARLLFASLFLLFNVGLPVLVDSCPMPKPIGSMMCPLCQGDGGEARGEVVKGKPCCEPSIAAERNTNEFLGIHKIACDPPADAGITVPSALIDHCAVSQAPASTPSQFAPDDIPVIYSSLLI